MNIKLTFTYELYSYTTLKNFNKECLRKGQRFVAFLKVNTSSIDSSIRGSSRRSHPSTASRPKSRQNIKFQKVRTDHPFIHIYSRLSSTTTSSTNSPPQTEIARERISINEPAPTKFQLPTFDDLFRTPHSFPPCPTKKKKKKLQRRGEKKLAAAAR